MVKFKIGFTVEAETLFSYVSRLMPALQDLHVEEIYDKPEPITPRIPKIAAKIFENMKLEPPIPHERKKHRKPFKHPSGKVLTDFVLEFVEKSKGDVTWASMAKFSQSLGYEKSSINNAVSRLIERGLVERRGSGVYGIKKK